MANLTYTLAQLNPTVGDVSGNAKKLEAVWAKAKTDLVIFPELFLCGYPPEDLVLKPLFLNTIKHCVDRLVEKSRDWDAAALLSVPWVENHKTYSALMLVHKGKILHSQYKVLLPNYGVFDEERIFEPGPMPNVIKFNGTTLGLMICEDLWYPHVAAKLADDGADILIAVNGSPFSIDNIENRMSNATARVMETELPLIYVNQVGGQDELVFDGASFALNAKGQLVHQSPAFEEAVSIYPDEQSIASEPSSAEMLYNAVTLGLKDYVRKNGFPGVVLGLSGGIDSALVAAIAVDALGPDKVHCVMMPSAFTSDESLEDARACADNLGVRYDIIPIAPMVEAFEQEVPDLTGVAHENIQSRIRGNIVMALSNSSGDMVVSTGNKSEMAVGYATLYGDMNGGFNPLKDLYKTQVYALASWRNSQSPVIPGNIITKAPTAELREDQKDLDSLPAYEVLDDILIGLIEEEADVKALEKRGHERGLILKVWGMLDRAEYKRRQACPGVKVTAKSFGRDRRYPITNAFFQNIEKA